jgi:hypothetical protein
MIAETCAPSFADVPAKFDPLTVTPTTQWKFNQSPRFDSAKPPFPREARETFRTKSEYWFEAWNLRDRRTREKPEFVGFLACFTKKKRETGLGG